jgi:hypothetical protein
MIVPLGPHLDVEPALLRGLLDRAVEIELVGGTLAREAAEAPERHLDVARAQLDLVVEIGEIAPVPDLDRAVVAVAVLADADALGVIAVGAVGRLPGRADPFVAALVAALLLGEALLQLLHQLFPAAHGLDLLLLLLGEMQLGHLAQPFLGNVVDREQLGERVEALEHVTEHAVELVEVALVLHQRRTREIVEIVDAIAGNALLHRFEQREVFPERDRDVDLAQFEEELGEHVSFPSPPWGEGDFTCSASP